MVTTFNQLYINFPVFLYQISNDEHITEYHFYNVSKTFIHTITLSYQKKRVELNVNTKEEVITAKKQNSDIPNINFKPELISCVSRDGREYFTKDFHQTILSPPQSIFSLRSERFLYVRSLKKKKQGDLAAIKYIAEQKGDFWYCTCGHLNLMNQNHCLVCQNDRDVLLNEHTDYDFEAKQTRFEIGFYKYAAIFLFLIFVFQLMYQGFLGDFLFNNQVKNEAFGIFNRMVVPGLMMISAAMMILAKQRYMKTLIIAMELLYFASALYLNLVSSIIFIGSTYNLPLLIVVDILIIYYVIAKYLKNIDLKITDYIRTGLVVAFTFVIAFSWAKFSQYELTIVPNGVELTVETDDVNYIVPETVNNMAVVSVRFLPFYEYQIERLTLNKNIQNMYIYSSAVLDQLETIAIAEGNENYYVEDNILYHTDGRVAFVPISIQSLTVDNLIIESGEFRDLYNLKSLVIGSNVIEIKAEAFANAYRLESVIFEENSSLETIGRNAFYNAQSLTSISLPISLESMGLGVLEGANSLTYLKTPFIGEEREVTDDLSSSTDVLVYLFGSRTYLHNTLIPESLETIEIFDITRIHNVTFYRASHLVTILLPATLSDIGIRSFYGTSSLSSFTVPDGVLTIDESAFEMSGITSIVIPASVTTIEANAFLNTNLSSVIYLGDTNDLTIDPTGNQVLINLLTP